MFLKSRRADEMKGVSNDLITVTLPDGKSFDGEAWVTTPFIIAGLISSGLAKASIVAKVKYSSRVSLPFQGEMCLDDGMEDEMESKDDGDEGKETLCVFPCFAHTYTTRPL